MLRKRQNLTDGNGGKIRVKLNPLKGGFRTFAVYTNAKERLVGATSTHADVKAATAAFEAIVKAAQAVGWRRGGRKPDAFGISKLPRPARTA